jgi:hypothetical protein
METQRMSVLKEASIETIKRLPEECSVDDIMYEINFVAQVDFIYHPTVISGVFLYCFNGI